MSRRRLLGKANGTILGFLSHNSPVPLLGSKFFVFIIAVRVRSRSTTMDYNVFGAERAVTAPSRQRQTNSGSASIISPFGLLPTAVHNWTEVFFCLFSPFLFVSPLFPFFFFFGNYIWPRQMDRSWTDHANLAFFAWEGMFHVELNYRLGQGLEISYPRARVFHAKS